MPMVASDWMNGSASKRSVKGLSVPPRLCDVKFGRINAVKFLVLRADTISIA